MHHASFLIIAVVMVNADLIVNALVIEDGEVMMTCLLIKRLIVQNEFVQAGQPGGISLKQTLLLLMKMLNAQMLGYVIAKLVNASVLAGLPADPVIVEHVPMIVLVMVDVKV